MGQDWFVEGDRRACVVFARRGGITADEMFRAFPTFTEDTLCEFIEFYASKCENGELIELKDLSHVRKNHKETRREKFERIVNKVLDQIERENTSSDTCADLSLRMTARILNLLDLE